MNQTPNELNSAVKLMYTKPNNTISRQNLNKGTGNV